MANAINKDNVKIWLAPANTEGADLSNSGEVISGYVTSFSDSGFEKTFEQLDVAGGNVNATQARTSNEYEFEVVLHDGVNRDIFHRIKMGEYDLGVAAVQKQIDSSEFLWVAVNNIGGINFEGDFSMDGQWEGTVSLSSTAFDDEGRHNWDFGTEDIADASNGLIAGKERTLADGTTRTNSWEESS